MRNRVVSLAFASGLLTACPNPADDAPKAEVSQAAASKPAAASSAASAPGTAEKGGDTAPLKIDSKASKIAFVGSKVTGKHDGGFKDFSGTIHLSKDVTASKMEVNIDMTSVFSDDEKLTGHLKSPDFFDVEKFPTAKFVLDAVEAGNGTEGSTHTLKGQLTFHGVTKSIAFPASITVTDALVSAKSEFSLNRKDFGVNYPGKADDLIRDDVLVKLDVKAPR